MILTFDFQKSSWIKNGLSMGFNSWSRDFYFLFSILFCYFFSKAGIIQLQSKCFGELRPANNSKLKQVNT